MIENIKRNFTNYQSIQVPDSYLGRRQAAVLIPLRKINQQVEVLLTQRAGNLNTHGGEVAFPGGKQDASDASLQFTALRETHEEIGIAPEQITVLGELRPYVSKFGLLVTPFVGIVSDKAEIVVNPDEIESVFSVPLSYFETAKPIRIDQISRHSEDYEVPVYKYQGYEIWGLTAMIMIEFLTLR